MRHSEEIGFITKIDNQERIAELRPLQLLIELGKVTDKMVCVDLGCGTGVFTIPMAEIMGTKGLVYAVDKLPYLLEYMKKHTNSRQIVTINRDMFNNGLHSRIADRCLLSSVLSTTKLPMAVLLEARRLIKDSGVVIIVEPYVNANLGFKAGKIAETTVQELLASVQMSYEYHAWSEKHYVVLSRKMVDNGNN